MAPVVTLRPNKRTTVWLPWRPRGGNYKLLKEIRGPGTQEARWDPVREVFEVPRANGDNLIQGLVNEFGSVRVVIHGHSRTTCVSDCWKANPLTVWDCVCSCAGSNHGSKHPLRHQVAEVLSIEHEYTVAHWDVDEEGWTLVA